jgi:hypothetical protein
MKSAWSIAKAIAWLSCSALVVLPGCAPEGAGSIKIDRSYKSQVMRVPDRKAPGPRLAQAHRGRPVPKLRPARR